MSWLGEGFSSLKGHVQNLAQGVLTEDVETDRVESGPVRKSKTEAPHLTELTPRESTSAIQSEWDEVVQSTDKFIGQDGNDVTTSEPSTAGNKNKESPSKEETPEKDVASILPRGLVSFFNINFNEALSPTNSRAAVPKYKDSQSQTETLPGLQETVGQTSGLQEENRRLLLNNTSLSNEVNTLSRRIRDLESQVAVSQDENSNISTGLEELDIQHQQAIEHVIVAKDETQKMLDMLMVDHHELKQKYDDLLISQEKSMKMSMMTDKGTNTDVCQTSENKEMLLLRELEERDEELQASEEQNAALRNSIKELTSLVEKLKENLPPIQENSEEIETLEQRVMCLESEVSILNEVRSNLERDLEVSKGNMDELSQNLRMSGEIIKNQQNIVLELSKTKESEHLKSRELENKSSTISKLKEDMEKLVTSNKKLTLENNSLCKKNSQLESHLQQLDLQLENVQKDNETKDRKMCEILLEATATEEEYKVVKETLEQKYSALKEEFSSFQMSMSEQLHEKDNEIECIKSKQIAILDSDSDGDNGVTSLKSEFEKEIIDLKEKQKSAEKNLKQEIEKKNIEIEKKNIEIEKKNIEEQNLYTALSEVESLKIKLVEQDSIMKSYLSQVSTKNKEMEKLKQEYAILEVNLKNKISILEKKLESLNNISQEFEIYKDIAKQKDIEFKNQLQAKDDEILKCKITIKDNELLNRDKLNELETKFQEILTANKNEIAELKTKELDFEKCLEELSLEHTNLGNDFHKKIIEINELNENYRMIVENLSDYKTKNTLLEKEIIALNKEREHKTFEKSEIDANLRSENEKYKEENKQLKNSCESQSTIISKLKDEMVNLVKQKDSVLMLNAELEMKYQGLVKETEALRICSNSIKELQQHTLELEAEKGELKRSLQLKHAESSGYQSEKQRLSALLNSEAAKNEDYLIERIELNNRLEQLEAVIKEKLTIIEQVETNYGKQLGILNQEVESLKNQLEYASQLLSVVDRQEAEGQNVAEQKTCPEGCVVTLEELRRLGIALLNEQTNNKVLANKVEEISEKYSKAESQLITLKKHLVEVEENYSGELIIAREKINEIQSRLAQADERVRSSSTAYTSANIRANQQVEVLTLQVKVLTEQKDKLETELSKAEDREHKQAAAVTNLQAVLHQFQRDKQKDIDFETERIRQSLNEAHKSNNDLNQELKHLMEQLNEAKKGLSAATRLSEQLEKKSETINSLKQEVINLTEKLKQQEEKIKAAHTNVEGKVDRCLVKNLIVGYIAAPPTGKVQVLRVIATVLDLNKEERQKVGLELGPNQPLQSLSEAFIHFLETESQPKVLLPLAQAESPQIPSRKSSHSGSTSILLSDTSPNLPHFTLGRNPSAILKDVLNDKST